MASMVWVALALRMVSPGTVELWEAAVLLAVFPCSLLHAYVAYPGMVYAAEANTVEGPTAELSGHGVSGESSLLGVVLRLDLVGSANAHPFEVDAFLHQLEAK
jgi:hypothetical protein